jgi:hypothetical protein
MSVKMSGQEEFEDKMEHSISATKEEIKKT